MGSGVYVRPVAMSFAISLLSDLVRRNSSAILFTQGARRMVDGCSVPRLGRPVLAQLLKGKVDREERS